MVAPLAVTASGKSPLVKCRVVGQGTGRGTVGVRARGTRGHTAVTRARSARGLGQRGPGGGRSPTSPGQRVPLREAGSEVTRGVLASLPHEGTEGEGQEF